MATGNICEVIWLRNAELHDLTTEHFFPWFSHYDYVEGLLESGGLVVRADRIPGELVAFIEEARRCYAFQQYLATCAVCRTMLEIALRDLCQYEGLLEINQNAQKYVEDFDYSVAELRDKLTKLKDFAEFYWPIRDLYKELSRVLHGNHQAVNKVKARTFLERTLLLIHKLYEA